MGNEDAVRNMANEKLKNLGVLFNPKTVALVGASSDLDKLGSHVLKSLTCGEFSGKIFPVNPKGGVMMGLEAYASLKEIPDPVDLVVIIIPAQWVLGVVKDCVEIGVKGIVMITGGFKEVGDENGTHLQAQIAELANEAGIPIIGPNTFGILNLGIGMNASFSPDFSAAKKGRVAIVSQSGGVTHVIGYMSMRNNVGLSKVMGLGNRCNIDFADVLVFLMNDPDTKVIAMYIEGVDDPRQLIETAQKYRGRKPVVVLKSGSAAQSNEASLSHTGTLAGSHDIYAAGFRQAGILCVNSVEEMVDAVKILDAAPLWNGINTAIISGQAGPAIIACDALDRNGLAVLPFNKSLQSKVNDILPPLTMRSNPVDLGPAWYKLELFKKITEVICEDDDIAAILLVIVLGEGNSHFIKGVSAMLSDLSERKPVVGCFVFPTTAWDKEVEAIEETSAFVSYPSPERAAAALANLCLARKIEAAIE